MSDLLATLEPYALPTLAVLALAVFITRSFSLVKAGSAVVIERFGRFARVQEPGFRFRCWPLESARLVVDMGERSIALEDQECFTSDNVRITLSVTLHARIIDPKQVTYAAKDPWAMLRSLARATLRSSSGSFKFDALFEDKGLIPNSMLYALREPLLRWGILVSRVEVNGLVANESVIAALEAQLKAEREKLSRIAKSEGIMEARINAAQAMKEELANRGYGRRSRFESEAEGKATSLLTLARASAESIRKSKAAMDASGGPEATRYALTMQYLEALGELAKKDTKVTIGLDLCAPSRDPLRAGLFSKHEKGMA